MKYRFNVVLLAAAAICVSAWTAVQAEDRVFGDGTLPDHLAVYDVDGDGVLSVEEIQAMRDARHERRHGWLEQWDANEDGVIDEEERAAAHEALRQRIEERREARFNEADTDGDGCLTFEEFSAIPAVMALAEEHPEAPARIYARLDANHDECVSLEEFLGHLRDRRHDDWRTAETYGAADVDENGCLTLEEFSAIPAIVRLAQDRPNEPARIYGVLDADEDGCLTVVEFTADVHLGQHRDTWRTAELYAAVDVDENGCLTLEEFSAIPLMVHLAQEHPEQPTRIYSMLDSDEDHCLTVEEFTAVLGSDEPPPPPPPPPPPGPGGNRE